MLGTIDDDDDDDVGFLKWLSAIDVVRGVWSREETTRKRNLEGDYHINNDDLNSDENNIDYDHVHDEDDCGGGGDVVFIITWNLSRVRNRIDCIVIVNGDGLLVIMSAHF